ncbi:MAG: Flp family type IVb pilin [Rhizobiales bacterium PAR1]|nr:MAG: Flp family type IVb pilin [Rhizobiales bacterium PAR1]
MSTARALHETLNAFILDEAGATSIEYGLLAAGMATAVISAFSSLSDALQQGFQGIGMLINPPMTAGASMAP